MKCTIIEMNSTSSTKVGKCDMSKCATMTKDECAKMCDSLGCSAEEKKCVCRIMVLMVNSLLKKALKLVALWMQIKM